ncbi:MAG: hypothetical protein COT18_04835 [Elusimicrobia bacterium CG08_land_8_20_14_0_20_59_10]|nr:MAG: hypothetical protein COT18_04835 [Elusimicrobia bacterium CG08_land_8_20_14_0_20_59_10]
MNGLHVRRGSGVVSILVAVVVLIVLFMFISGFGDTARRMLESSLVSKTFQKRFPGSDRPGRLDAAGRAALVNSLTAALRDPDPVTRKLAGSALGRIGPEALPAVPELVRLLRSSEPESRRGALAGLEGISGLSVPKRVQWAFTGEAMDWRARKALRAINTPEARAAAAAYTGPCPRLFKAPDMNWCD